MDETRAETQELQSVSSEAIAEATIDERQTIWNNPALYSMAVKQAKILASSDLVPESAYKGRPANCLIALDMANRMGMSPLHVMQNLFIVKGRPGWSGQFCIAAVNGCGRFSPLEFVQLLNDDGSLRGYYAQCTNIATGKLCTGAPVTWDMVKAEGWYDKSGSKWKTMPEQMFMYRCAAFFARTYCPEVLNGLQTADELRDVNGYDEDRKTTVVTLD
nr:MAG TPA: RecT protein [Caudoviricetes sp.]